MKIVLTPHAYWHLQWMAHRTPCEVSSMGLLAPAREGLLIEDFILVRQVVSPITVQLDMEWWAEKQLELYERRGIEPWRTSCWTHTHPAEINGPSGTDEETMANSFGRWDFALMLILTKAGVFYARMDFDHAFGPGKKNRLGVQCSVHVDWSAPGYEPITPETLGFWNTEFQKLVQEETIIPSAHRLQKPWLEDYGGSGLLSNPVARAAFEQEMEVDDYVRFCESIGVDPNDLDGFGAEHRFVLDPPL